MLAGQFAGEVFAGLEAATGDQFAVEIGKAQLQQWEGLGEGGAVVEDGIDTSAPSKSGWLRTTRLLLRIWLMSTRDGSVQPSDGQASSNQGR